MTDYMKILFVSAVFPYPLYSGGQVRVFNLLKRLSKKHDISLFSFIRTDDEEQYKKNVSFCRLVTTVKRGRAWQLRYVLRAVTSSYPLLLSTYDSTRMKELIEKELQTRTYDIVHIEPGYVWPSIPTTTIPVVVSEHNIEHEVYTGFVKRFPVPFFRFLLSSDVNKLKNWEAKIWQQAAHVVAVFDGDKKKISHVVDSGKISVVKNGVDLASFPFKPKTVSKNGKITFLYVGNFAWMENRDAVFHLLKDIWPAIVERYPQAHLRIVGKNLPENLRGMGTISSVSFLEHVENIQTELALSDIMLAPIRIGGGTKYKLLEAMASGLPVITTKFGANGLLATHDKEICIADSEEEVLQAIHTLVQGKRRMIIVTAARKLIEKNYSWETIADDLNRVWEEAHARRN
jgi:polysaccharide biosynthesis protein PslH